MRIAYDLRPRPHNYVLPPKDDKNFIPRPLYKLTFKAALTTPLGLLYYPSDRRLIKLLSLFNF